MDNAKARIGVLNEANRRMQQFLRDNGFPYAVARYMEKGSIKGSWRIYSKPRGGKLDDYERWTTQAADKLNGLGFTDMWGKPLGPFSGNGGYFMVFVVGHNEFLGQQPARNNPFPQ